jgi:hypothetical protein
MTEAGRTRARLAMGLVAALGELGFAVRGDVISESLEVKVIFYIGDDIGHPDEELVPLITVGGHAGAPRGVLNASGLDALIDALVIARGYIEGEETRRCTSN